MGSSGWPLSTFKIFVVDKKWPHSPMCQRAGVEFMYGAFHGVHRPGCRGCILGDGMGMGKTVQSISLIHTLLAAKQVWPASVPSPGPAPASHPSATRPCAVSALLTLVSTRSRLHPDHSSPQRSPRRLCKRCGSTDPVLLTFRHACLHPAARTRTRRRTRRRMRPRTRTRPRPRTCAHAPALTRPHTIAHTYTHTHTHAHAHAHTLSHKYTLSHAHAHAHAHT